MSVLVSDLDLDSIHSCRLTSSSTSAPSGSAASAHSTKRTERHVIVGAAITITEHHCLLLFVCFKERVCFKKRKAKEMNIVTRVFTRKIASIDSIDCTIRVQYQKVSFTGKDL